MDSRRSCPELIITEQFHNVQRCTPAEDSEEGNGGKKNKALGAEACRTPFSLACHHQTNAKPVMNAFITDSLPSPPLFLYWCILKSRKLSRCKQGGKNIPVVNLLCVTNLTVCWEKSAKALHFPGPVARPCGTPRD